MTILTLDSYTIFMPEKYQNDIWIIGKKKKKNINNVKKKNRKKQGMAVVCGNLGGENKEGNLI